MDIDINCYVSSYFPFPSSITIVIYITVYYI